MAVTVDRPDAVSWGTRWAHLWADDGAELLAFARRLNLPLGRWQDAGEPNEHFDITEAEYLRARRLGARDFPRAVRPWQIWRAKLEQEPPPCETPNATPSSAIEPSS